MDLVGPLAFDEVGHIEIDVVEVGDVVLFCILHVVEVEHELVGTIAVKHDIGGIVGEIGVNHGLKSAVETVVKLPHVGLPIDLAEVSGIHVKLLLELGPDAVRGQSVKEFRQNDGPILTPLRKQGGDISITDLIQQCSTHHICEGNSV